VTATDRALPTPSGYPALATTVFGGLLVLAGAAVLGSAVLPQVVPTIGPDPLTFWPADTWDFPTGNGETGLLFGSLVLPAAGFGLAYKDAGAAARRWISGVGFFVFAAQSLMLAAAVVWMTGLGLGAESIIAAPADKYAVAVISPVCLFVCAAAAAIMNVLGRRTTFDGRSDEYFATGSAVVRVNPLPVALHALWLLLAIAAWTAIVYLPLAAIAGVEALDLPFTMDRGVPQPWPRRPDDDFELAQVVYGGTVGIIAGAVLSSLLKKVLYRTVLRGTVGRVVNDAMVNRWRSIQPFVHYPLAISGLAATVCVLITASAVGSGAGVDSGAVGLFAVLGLLAAVVGIVLVANVWRTGDDPLRDLPIHQAVAGDVRGSFRTPSKRTRTSKREPKRTRGGARRR
jgi:hypothetical protein